MLGGVHPLQDPKLEAVLFGTQLALNVLWSYVCLERRAPGWALAEIC